jgi:hypothetical protein
MVARNPLQEQVYLVRTCRRVPEIARESRSRRSFRECLIYSHFSPCVGNEVLYNKFRLSERHPGDAAGLEPAL